LGDFVAAGAAAGDEFAAGDVAAGDVAAGEVAGAGGASAVGDGVGEGDATGTLSEDSAELGVLIPGSDSISAISMNAIAAPIVTFARMF
jgi:hypothetical protein